MTKWQPAPVPRNQIALFTRTLDDRIPPNHPVRLLDEILDQVDWSAWEADYHGRLGQPAIHPKVMCAIILYALLRRLRSTRQIEYALSHHIDFIWLASGRTIDHTTVSIFRTKHKKRLKELYRQITRLALRMGVARLAEVCLDGTRIKANASRFNTLTAEKAAALEAALEAQIQQALDEMEQNDECDELFDEPRSDQLPPALADLQARQAKVKELMQQLREMDEARQKSGIDPKKNPAQLPAADPDARVLPNKEGGYAPNYTPMAVTETVHGFIVAADVVIGNVEHIVGANMIAGLEADYDEKPETVLADSAYATGANIQQFQEQQVDFVAPLPISEPTDNPAIRDDPTTPVAEDKIDQLPINKQTKRFDKSAFIYDETKDCYYCPTGKTLTHKATETVHRLGGTVVKHKYECNACDDCPLSARCRGNKRRQVSHDEHEPSRQRHREKMSDPAVKEQYKRRLHYGETPFAFIKQAMQLRQFLVRGIENVQQEWVWNCTAFNIRKLMSLWDILRAELAAENK